MFTSFFCTYTLTLKHSGLLLFFVHLNDRCFFFWPNLCALPCTHQVKINVVTQPQRFCDSTPFYDSVCRSPWFFVSTSNKAQWPLCLARATLKMQFKSFLFFLNILLFFLNGSQHFNFFFLFCWKEKPEILHLTLPKILLIWINNLYGSEIYFPKSFSLLRRSDRRPG